MGLFVNRIAELNFLEEIYKKPGKHLVVLCGRRRVGKTELLLHFAKDKPRIYFLADKRGSASNATRFAKICSQHFKDLEPKVGNFDEAFEYIAKRAKNEKLIVIIDEFSYLVEKDDSIPSVFQLIIDEILKETNITIILNGSSISMMQKGTLSYKSPLYGRRDGDWKLKPLNFKEFTKFHTNLNIEDSITRFSIIGGIPAYVKKFEGKDTTAAIKESILTKGSFLYDEPQVLLQEELREPTRYLSILEAMTHNSKLVEIANFAKMTATEMPAYLGTLMEIEIVEKINPVTEKNSKKTQYSIKDNFFKFWFKFIYPNKTQIEERQVNETLEQIKKELPAYTGRCFEQICLEYLKSKIQVTKIGKWWDKTIEIDVVAINENTREITFAECKWSKEIDAQAEVEKLKEKAKSVKWKANQKEKFFLFAKSFQNTTEEAKLVNLKEMEKWLKI